MTDLSQATPESIWAILRKVSKGQEELNQQMKETDQQMKETDRIVKETALQMKETDRRLNLLDKTFGSWANNQGFIAEEYFYNSFEQGEQNFFGERFDEIEKNVKGIKKNFKDEYDILLINGKSIGIVEIKYKAHENDIPEVLRKAETFRVNFPEYANHRVYLGLATFVFYPELEKKCIDEGIAVVKQVGENIIINDKHLKVF